MVPSRHTRAVQGSPRIAPETALSIHPQCGVVMLDGRHGSLLAAEPTGAQIVRMKIVGNDCGST